MTWERVSIWNWKVAGSILIGQSVGPWTQQLDEVSIDTSFTKKEKKH